MICRVCLQKVKTNPLQIFGSNGEQPTMATIIQQHFWFTPLPDDAISTVLCAGCWLKISDFHEFYESVKQVQKDLYENVLEDETKGNVLHENVVSVKEEPEPIVVNPLYEPEVRPESIVFEVKDEDRAKCIVNIEVGSALSENEDAFHDTEEPFADAVDALNDTDSQEFQVAKRTRKRRKNVLKVAKVVKEKKPKPSQSQKRQMRPLSSPMDDSVIKKHIHMNCDLCAFIGEDFPALTKHFQATHIEEKPYVLCCGRKFFKRFLLVQHAYKHEDPEYFKCDECQKVFSDGYILRTHIVACHSKDEELTYECDQCSKRFSRRYLLELHKPVHIPINERKFFCPQCPEPQSKAFASPHLLQIHVNMCHIKATNVCHVCAKEIRDGKAFKKHVRRHFEDSGPRVKCPKPGCDRWLKDDYNLKQHVRRHNNEGKMIYTCDECGKICKNRISLTSHMNYAHRNEVFSCGECHKTFKRAITLKEHMAQHTGEALYKCPFCTRTFNSNANMHAHKKKLHPVEWDIWRKTKRGSSQKLLSKTTVSEMMLTNE